MKTITNEVKNAFKQPTTKRKGMIIVNGNYYDVYNVKYNSDCYDEGKVIGNAIASQLDFDVPYMEKFDTFQYIDCIWVGNGYEYIDYGTFNVFDEQNQDEFNKHITAFDNLIKFNAPFEDKKNYPKNLYQELENICQQAGVALINQSITNGDFVIKDNQFVNGENLKTILKQICSISGNYAIVKNDSLYLQLKNETNEMIDKSQHEPVDWKRRSYGINQVILGDSQIEGEYVIREDADDIALNGVHKLEILDNLFANTQEKRNALIDNLFNQVRGFGYIPFETKGEWLSYLEIGDTINLDGIDTILLRINASSPDALKSTISAPAIIDSSIDYVDNTNDTNNRLKRTEISVDKQNQTIESVVSQTEEQNEKISRITQTVDELNSKISDIADITTSNESNAGYVDLEGINESEPIRIVVRPVVENISYLYPSAFLYPSNDLFMKSRILRFTNKTTGVSIDYELPNDLWYLDSEHYDEFVLDYDAGTCQVIKRLEYRLNDIATGVDLSSMELRMNFPDILGAYANIPLFYSENYRVVEIFQGDNDKIVLQNSNTFETIETFYEQHGSDDAIINLKSYKLPDDFGEVIFVASEIEALQTQAQALNYMNFFDNKLYIKPIEQTIDYPYPIINLEDGDYRISLPGYTYGYIFARLMAKNIYTTQFATYAYVNSEITQTATEITSMVEEGYATKDTTNSLSSRISQTAKSIELVTTDNNTSAGITIRLKNENGTAIDSKSANITMSGLVKFTDLSGSGSTTINGSNITTGTIDASKVTVKNLNASNITSGTISGSKISGGTINGNNVTISNLNASNITSGTLSADKISGGTINASNIAVTNITASNINRGSLTGANIDINNGTGFLKMLSGSAYNPYVSALNVSNKSNGISFRNSNSSGNAGSQIGTLHTENTNLVMDATGNILIGGSSMSAGAIGIWSGYLHAGNLNMGENYINNSNGGQIAINQSISLNTSGGGYAYVDGLYANNRILTVGGSPSTLSVKENVEKKDISNIPEILREIDLYDYKYKKEIEDGKEDYGYIIDYLEKIPNIEKYFEFYEAEKNGIKYKQISHEQLEKFLLGSVIELQRQLDEMKDMIYNMKERIDK